ncbi:MAG: hypothetical protein DRN95_02240 [Candidatus Hydrothermarchaeota archaeon]|nr:MAG: hypothetical protein DRN95_02240 [Candidatus Hydrothermarchaeota archaeon]
MKHKVIVSNLFYTKGDRIDRYVYEEHGLVIDVRKAPVMSRGFPIWEYRINNVGQKCRKGEWIRAIRSGIFDSDVKQAGIDGEPQQDPRLVAEYVINRIHNPL